MKAKEAVNLLCIMTMAGVMLLQGCKKDTVSEQFPQDKYIIAAEGLRMRSEPSLQGNRLALIPFGEKVSAIGKSETVLEVTDGTSGKKLQHHWYQVQWKGAKGWVFGGYIGDKSEYEKAFLSVLEKEKKYLVPEHAGLLGASDNSIDEVWRYPGGEMEKAEMYFCKNGLLIVDSGMFSERKKKYYFVFTKDAVKKTLSLIFVDTRLNFSDLAQVENKSKSVWGIDREKKTITYNIQKGTGADKSLSVSVFGWGFFEKEMPWEK
ncbi:MAG TPA: SH3 domain-containing protein [Spirochaetota bacterium]|nr:SH3 domain-containing protein [Spirochaetota bacterium]